MHLLTIRDNRALTLALFWMRTADNGLSTFYQMHGLQDVERGKYSSTTVWEIIKVSFHTGYVVLIFSFQNICTFQYSVSIYMYMLHYVWHISKLLELGFYNSFCRTCVYCITLFWIICFCFAINVCVVLYKLHTIHCKHCIW